MNRNYSELTEVKAGKTGYGLLFENDGHIMQDSDMVKQINEDITNHHKFVIPDRFIVPTIFQKFGIKNANGRIYPKDVLVPQVDKYIKERVEKRCAIGALDHPNSTSLSGHDVAHTVTHLEWDNQTLIGELELHLSPGYRKYGICSTSGDLVANMLLDDYLIGVSSRGAGNVEDQYGQMIVTEFELLCFDVVLEPSTPGAYMKQDKSELRPYVEGVNKNKSPLISEKIQKIAQILK